MTKVKSRVRIGRNQQDELKWALVKSKNSSAEQADASDGESCRTLDGEAAKIDKDTLVDRKQKQMQRLRQRQI